MALPLRRAVNLRLTESRLSWVLGLWPSCGRRPRVGRDLLPV